MNTNVLRQKVYDMAAGGKLVSQNPQNIPADVLLERLGRVKEQMVKDGRIKPRALKYDSVIYKGEDNRYYESFPDGRRLCVDKDIPFRAPHGWEWSRLGNIAFVTKLSGSDYTGKIAPYAKKSMENGGVPVFKGKNIRDNKITYEFDSYIPQAVSKELSRTRITGKCVLTPCVGTIGNVGIHKRPGTYHLGSNVAKIELYGGLILEECIFWYLKSSFGYDRLAASMKATAQSSISIEAIRNLLIPVPPVEEQLLIYDKISEIFENIDIIEKNKEEISELISGIKLKILALATEGKLITNHTYCETAGILLQQINNEKLLSEKHKKNKVFSREERSGKSVDNSYYVKFSTNEL